MFPKRALYPWTSLHGTRTSLCSSYTLGPPVTPAATADLLVHMENQHHNLGSQAVAAVAAADWMSISNSSSSSSRVHSSGERSMARIKVGPQHQMALLYLLCQQQQHQQEQEQEEEEV